MNGERPFGHWLSDRRRTLHLTQAELARRVGCATVTLQKIEADERRPSKVYRPLFWAGLWGIPFGLLIKTAWKRLYLFGLLYFLAPLLALYTIFLPMSGAGYFGLQRGGPMFAVYLLLVNLPYGIITALAARAIIGKRS
ncbi:MAG: helix-turn-helix domain-containing protein [Acidobacteriia bacterium]|nr:helix-turn-helix domain-containing protein [Terriglobia bacterium]